MSELSNTIAFENIGLGGILSHYRLEVPPNQREYSWESGHVTKLLVDFTKAIGDDNKGYFLGTVVTIPAGNGVLEVVDGQQRLATSSLLLAAIRDKAAGNNMLVEHINNHFLTAIDMADEARVPNLRLNTDDNELFAALITKQKAVPQINRASHKRMIDAYVIAAAHIQKVLAPHDPINHIAELKKWISFIEHRAQVVLLRVSNGANAYRMFETLNDRGLRTSQADMVKSYLIDKAASRKDEVQARWSQMRGSLEAHTQKDITVSFLRHALIVQRGLVRESEVYDEVQLMVGTKDKAVSFATDLESLSYSYVATFNPEHEKWNGYAGGVRQAIVVFNLLATKPLRPLILAIAEKFDKKETLLAFQFLVSLSARLTITGGTTSGSLDEVAAEVAVDVFSGEVTTAAKFKKRVIDITPTDASFREAVASARVTQARFARYYLRAMEMAHKGAKEAYFIPSEDQTTINLEHVLPKSPMKNWPTFAPEEAELWLNRLGNLVLMKVSENSDSKSAPFSEKKALYAASAYELTKQVASFSEWTVSAIESRQKAMADLAVKTWPI